MILPLLIMAFQQPPAAQTRPPVVTQTVVVTAATQPVPLDAVARAVTIITREEIEGLPAWSLTDLLRLSSSLDVRARGTLGVQTDLSGRGGGFGQTLVLVDGVRLNDSQSGHHNADIPVPIDQVERIEIVRGTGSSLFGTDAVDGTLNIITRAGAQPARASIEVGEHGLVKSGASASTRVGGVAASLNGWGARTSGFMFDRDVATGGASLRASLPGGRTASVSHLRNAFGANGFYGASPSKEWTDQTLVAVTDPGGRGRWRTATRAAYRTHGDHFLWDVNRPGFAENRHRTQALTAAATVRHGEDRNWTSIGAEAGMDWIRSNNLGDHDIAHAALLLESQRAIGSRTIVYPALRYDRYSVFGDNWSPSLAAIVAVAPGVRLRASAGRAFRVPTFTERFYHDPGNVARADTGPERAVGVEGGMDWSGRGLTATITPLWRHETNVIDWVRETTLEPWHTANIRKVGTKGVEAGVMRAWSRGFLRAEYTWIRSTAPSLGMLSKYVLDYAPRALAVSGTLRAPGAFLVGARGDCKHRADGRSYCGVDTRVSRPVGRVEIYVDVSNVSDVHYQEISGVDAAPRWLAAGLRVGR
jgi:iron complex outermembrane receptor protein